MGMQTILYGYIEEIGFWKDPVKSYIREHNKAVIEGLPLRDEWPPVSREMFSLTEGDPVLPGPSLDYKARIIHFGASLKQVESEWGEWRAKFERLLSQLYFYEARVHLNSDGMGQQLACWGLDIMKYDIVHDGSVPVVALPEQWIYEEPEFERQ
jgi:hypothetical protein